MKTTALSIATAALLAGCATGDARRQTPYAAADLQSPAGVTLARAQVRPVTGGLRVYVEAAGLPPGTYAVHVHTTGRCEGPGFTSAGGHWNPTSRQHGTLNPAGAHYGDLPNLVVGSGTGVGAHSGTISLVIPGASLRGGAAGLLDEDGAAVIVHARADDYRTDPAGNAGDRIACGVLTERAPASGGDGHGEHKGGDAH
jgi:superoxide dismutase, Cu-Zn family